VEDVGSSSSSSKPVPKAPTNVVTPKPAEQELKVSAKSEKDKSTKKTAVQEKAAKEKGAKGKAGQELSKKEGKKPQVLN
jgi:hypothetical protein